MWTHNCRTNSTSQNLCIQILGFHNQNRHLLKLTLFSVQHFLGYPSHCLYIIDFF